MTTAASPGDSAVSQLLAEIDGLAAEVLHVYEELHLLYDLGAKLAGRLSLDDAVELILDDVLITLNGAQAELHLEDAAVPFRVRTRGEVRPADLAEPGGDRYLSTAVRSGGRVVCSIALARRLEAEPFTSRDSKLLDAVGSLAGNAIRSGQLYQELGLREAHLRAVLDNVADAILVIGSDGTIASLNPAAERIFGYRGEDVSGQPFGTLLADRYRREYQDRVTRWLATGGRGVTTDGPREAVGQRRDGSTFPLDVAISEMRVTDSQCYLIASARDITERKQAEAALEHQALHDALTDLPNRILLHDRLEQGILARQRAGGVLGLLLLDLDRFKEVNDTFGHQQGDLLLKEVSRRFRGALRGSDTIARLGGDEFAVLLPDADAASATLVARRLLAVLEEPLVVDGHDVSVGASIGVAFYPDHGADADTLLRRADVAMYVAKRGGLGMAVYAPDQDVHSAGRLAMVGDLRRAIEQDEFVLYYQPKADIRQGTVPSVEALIRWIHPEHGFIPPDQFIPLAEQTGLIKPLSAWVMTTALSQCHEWLETGLELAVAVNLSVLNIQDLQLPEMVGQLLDRWQVPPALLIVEITESSLMADPARALGVLDRLRAMGVQVAIDDFGTGYSSLTFLRQFPVNEIKIDRSFIRNIAVDEDDAAIVRSTITLGHDLGLTVVAEGVEDRATWDLLERLGCDIVQGYYFSRPMPESELTPRLQQWAGPHDRVMRRVA